MASQPLCCDENLIYMIYMETKGWLAIATLKPTFTFLGRDFAIFNTFTWQNPYQKSESWFQSCDGQPTLLNVTPPIETLPQCNAQRCKLLTKAIATLKPTFTFLGRDFAIFNTFTWQNPFQKSESWFQSCDGQPALWRQKLLHHNNFILVLLV